MGKFSDFKEKHDLTDVIGQYWGEVPIAGGAKICCQFHDDHNPSFSVYQKDGELRWNCFAGCGGGSVIDFIAKVTNMTPEQVVNEWTPGNKSVSTPKRKTVKKQKPKKEHKFTADMLTLAHLETWQEKLEYKPEAQLFLRNRGISEHMQKLFMLGFTGHDERLDYWQQNKLVIPYFRAIDEPTGYKLRDLTRKVYLKVGELDHPYGFEWFFICGQPFRFIVESELDALLINSILGCQCALAMPAGASGAFLSVLQRWVGHFIIIADNDENGRGQAHAEVLAAGLPGRSEVVISPIGKDPGDYWADNAKKCELWIKWLAA